MLCKFFITQDFIMKKYLCAVMFAFLPATTAYSQTDRPISLWLSILDLWSPAVKLGLEYQLSNNMGLAGVFGSGSINGKGMLEVGAQYNYYLTGNFNNGLHVGSELLFTNVTGTRTGYNTSFSVNAIGLNPYLGYKYSSRYGFTAILQGGVKCMYATADFVGRDFTSSPATPQAEGLLNINIGWSF